jgi:hypothetical protein
MHGMDGFHSLFSKKPLSDLLDVRHSDCLLCQLKFLCLHDLLTCLVLKMTKYPIYLGPTDLRMHSPAFPG